MATRIYPIRLRFQLFFCPEPGKNCYSQLSLAYALTNLLIAAQEGKRGAQLKTPRPAYYTFLALFHLSCGLSKVRVPARGCIEKQAHMVETSRLASPDCALRRPTRAREVGSDTTSLFGNTNKRTPPTCLPLYIHIPQARTHAKAPPAATIQSPTTLYDRNWVNPRSRKRIQRPIR